MIGLFASVGAFIASGEMAVAYFMAHFKSQAPLPIQNGGELAVLYCFIFLYIAAKGSGLWSVDSLRGAPATNL
jgi:putative oxidoreductase